MGEGGRREERGTLALHTPSSDDSTEVATKRMVVMAPVVLVMVWPWWERGEEEGVQAEDACWDEGARQGKGMLEKWTSGLDATLYDKVDERRSTGRTWRRALCVLCVQWDKGGEEEEEEKQVASFNEAKPPPLCDFHFSLYTHTNHNHTVPYTIYTASSYPADLGLVVAILGAWQPSLGRQCSSKSPHHHQPTHTRTHLACTTPHHRNHTHKPAPCRLLQGAW